MYTIVAVADGKEYPLHNLKSRRLIVSEPYFEIGDNLNGQAEFKVFTGHPYYGKVKKLTTDIIIRNDNTDMFYGRVLYDDEDSNGTKQVFVEGELAFLCDSIQRPRVYHNIGVRDYLTNVIKIHNDQVEARKHFTVGRVTVEDANDSLYRFSNWETTRETLKDKLSDRLGGHFIIRHENGIRFLDYLDDDDYYSRCTQQIKFGKNLLSFARNFDATDLATCIIPLGTTLEESSIEGLDERLTIKEVNGGKDYVTDDAAVAAYGKIYKTIIFDDITLPANLKTKGQKYLTQTQYEKMVLECKAIDLNFTDEEFERFTLGSLVRCVSKPHALDAWYPVTKQRFYLTNFKKNTITLGDESSNVSYTSSNRETTATFREDLETYRTGLTERIKKAHSDFKIAIDNANGLFSTEVEQENGSTITYYHNKKDLESSSIRLVFNDAGFAVSNNAGEDWYGIQVDGKFLADILYAYGVSAGWINTGVLRVTDAKGKEVLYVNVDTGVVRIVADDFSLTSGETIGSIASSVAKSEAEAAIEGQTQKDIFDKLTNNGKNQGIYLKNGVLYINGTYMEIGKISSKDGRVYFDLDNNELHCDMLVSTSNSAIVARVGTGYQGGSTGTSSGGGYSITGMLIYSTTNPKYSIALVPGSSDSDPDQIRSGKNGLKIQCIVQQGGGSRDTGRAGMTITPNGYTMICGQQTNANTNASTVEGSGTTQGMIIIEPYYTGYGTTYQSAGGIKLRGNVYCNRTIEATALSVSGTKNRIAKTENYQERMLYCYEMPSPMFGDIGEAQTDENGDCYVDIDDIFNETIRSDIEYQVFLQKEGPGEIWIEEKTGLFFHVKGTPDLKFAWELKAKQAGYETERLESRNSYEAEENIVSPDDFLEMELDNFILEQEAILYETA